MLLHLVCSAHIISLEPLGLTYIERLFPDANQAMAASIMMPESTISFGQTALV